MGEEKKERKSKSARMNKQGMNVREVIACFRKTERNTKIRDVSNPFILSTVPVGHVLIMTVFLFASVNILSARKVVTVLIYTGWEREEKIQANNIY